MNKLTTAASVKRSIHSRLGAVKRVLIYHYRWGHTSEKQYWQGQKDALEGLLKKLV